MLNKNWKIIRKRGYKYWNINNVQYSDAKILNNHANG